MEEVHYSCSISILKISLTIINFSEKIFSSFLSSLNSFLIMSGKQIILHKDFCSIRQNVPYCEKDKLFEIGLLPFTNQLYHSIFFVLKGNKELEIAAKS